MPAFIFPQMLLCGLFVDRDQMAPALEAISWLLPFTYAYDALELAISPASPGSDLVVDVIVVLACTFAALGLGAATLRRRTT
jgi:ABC-2 type transport system permease protein